MQGDHWILHDDSNRQALMNHLRSLDLSKPKAVKIEDKLPKRTDLQNRFLWGWVYANIARQLEDGGIVIPCDDGTEIPYTVDILHEWTFAERFRVLSEHVIKGRVQKKYESTATMSTIRFCEYVTQIKNFCYQYWRIQVPEPVGQQLKQWQEWAEEARKAA